MYNTVVLYVVQNNFFMKAPQFLALLIVEPRGGRNVGRPTMRWQDQVLNADKTGLNT
jgi:hypothetical protein